RRRAGEGPPARHRPGGDARLRQRLHRPGAALRRHRRSGKQRLEAPRREPELPPARGPRHRAAHLLPLGQGAMIGKPQTLWDARAALNFMLGGTGSGLMVAALFFPSREAFLIGTALVLVAGGLGAVWLEIGRKLRAVHVFFNPFTSWMSREALAAVVLFGLGILALVSRNQEL